MIKDKRPSSFLLHISLLAAWIVLLVACARMGNPDGGPYDETPPKVVRTSPKFGSANVKHAKKIIIEFDEMVKIDNAMEKVVISPPQIEQPEIEAVGKKVTVTLLDSLKPDMTYTIDFSDAIVDNNEGNPYGDYAFTFSTGEQVDTFQMSGNVLNASDLEPIKGILVGLYKVDSLQSTVDSLFKTVPFERISRTDSRGHFVVKGLSPGQYRAFALKDQNQNYIYDQRAEMVAFTERILETSSKPDLRPDTVWHDSIHYDSIVMTPYTHYYPDDIVLLAFESATQDRHKLKEERPIPQQFTIYFTAPSDTLPKLTGLNFNAKDAFIVDASKKNDTINYWIRDSLIYNLDTLEIQIDFFATDTTGTLALTTDTLYLFSKLTKEKIAKQQQEKYEEWVKECKQKAKDARRAARKQEQTLPSPSLQGGDSISVNEETSAQSNRPLL
ncbi:MAG: Ig-like domain-containing protein [Bacteroidaceae bacterium]|nr:Ig-like domain-containing protein [Bacteroidaceae bacterium]